MAPEHEAARGVAVEPVGERGLARQAEAQRVEIVLEARAALRPVVDGDSGGLVEDQHQPVAVEQPRSCFFGRHGSDMLGAARRARKRRRRFVDWRRERGKAESRSFVHRCSGRRERAGCAAPAARERRRQPRTHVIRRLRAVAAPPRPGTSGAPAPKRSWLPRLTCGPFALVVRRSAAASSTSSPSASSTPTSLDDLEDVLIQADLGLAAATRIREAVGRGRYDKGIDPDEVKRILAEEVERTLDAGRAGRSRSTRRRTRS